VSTPCQPSGLASDAVTCTSNGVRSRAPSVLTADKGDEVDAVGETPEQCPAALRVDYREALRHALDLGEYNVDQAQELGTEAAGARFIP